MKKLLDFKSLVDSTYLATNRAGGSQCALPTKEFVVGKGP